MSVELDLYALPIATFPVLNDLHQPEFCHAVPPNFNLNKLFLRFY